MDYWNLKSFAIPLKEEHRLIIEYSEGYRLIEVRNWYGFQRPSYDANLQDIKDLISYLKLNSTLLFRLCIDHEKPSPHKNKSIKITEQQFWEIIISLAIQ